MGVGVGGWISTSTSLCMAWSLGFRPRTEAREEGACRRGRELRVEGLFSCSGALRRGWASGHSKTDHFDLTLNRRLISIC